MQGVSEKKSAERRSERKEMDGWRTIHHRPTQAKGQAVFAKRDLGHRAMYCATQWARQQSSLSEAVLAAWTPRLEFGWRH
jgi:hypothetical protein